MNKKKIGVLVALLLAASLSGCTASSDNQNPLIQEQIADMELMTGAIQGQVTLMRTEMEDLKAELAVLQALDPSEEAGAAVEDALQTALTENTKLKRLLLETLLDNQLTIPQDFINEDWVYAYEEEGVAVKYMWVLTGPNQGYLYGLTPEGKIFWRSNEALANLKVYWQAQGEFVVLETGAGEEKRAVVHDLRTYEVVRQFSHMHQVYFTNGSRDLVFTGPNDQVIIQTMIEGPTTGLYRYGLYDDLMDQLDPGGSTYRCVIASVTGDGLVQYERRYLDGSLDHMGAQVQR